MRPRRMSTDYNDIRADMSVKSCTAPALWKRCSAGVGAVADSRGHRSRKRPSVAVQMREPRPDAARWPLRRPRCDGIRCSERERHSDGGRPIPAHGAALAHPDRGVRPPEGGGAEGSQQVRGGREPSAILNGRARSPPGSSAGESRKDRRRMGEPPVPEFGDFKPDLTHALGSGIPRRDVVGAAGCRHARSAGDSARSGRAAGGDARAGHQARSWRRHGAGAGVPSARLRPARHPGGAIGVGKTLTLVGSTAALLHARARSPWPRGWRPTAGGSIPIARIRARWVAACVLAQRKVRAGREILDVIVHVPTRGQRHPCVFHLAADRRKDRAHRQGRPSRHAPPRGPSQQSKSGKTAGCPHPPWRLRRSLSQPSL